MVEDFNSWAIARAVRCSMPFLRTTWNAASSISSIANRLRLAIITFSLKITEFRTGDYTHFRKALDSLMYGSSGHLAFPGNLQIGDAGIFCYQGKNFSIEFVYMVGIIHWAASL